MIPSRGGAQDPDPIPEEPPSDPDDTPFLRPRHGQLGHWTTPRPGELSRNYSRNRRFQLTVSPLYADFRLQFQGRGNAPVRGGGLGLEADFGLTRWLWARLSFAHSLHPVPAAYQVKEDTGDALKIANQGTISASSGAASIVYAVDLGRFLPLLDFGLGAIFVRSPKAAQNGQYGGACRNAQGSPACDVGLQCANDRVCRPQVMGAAHAGVGFDVLLSDKWAIGSQIRYFLFLNDPGSFPAYIIATARVALRF